MLGHASQGQLSGCKTYARYDGAHVCDLLWFGLVCMVEVVVMVGSFDFGGLWLDVDEE